MKKIDKDDVKFYNEDEISINYVFSHSKFPEIIFKDYKEFLKVATKGDAALSSFFYEVWEKVKKDILEQTKLKLIDKDLRVDSYNFQTMMINIGKNKQILNIVMPAISQNGECKFISLLIAKNPMYFTCELSKSFNESKPGDYYALGQWQYNEKKNQFVHKDHGRIDDFSLSKYLSEISKIV